MYGHPAHKSKFHPAFPLYLSLDPRSVPSNRVVCLLESWPGKHFPKEWVSKGIFTCQGEETNLGGVIESLRRVSDWQSSPYRRWLGVRKAHGARTKRAPASMGREENYGSRVICRGRGSLNALMFYVFIFLANWEPISMERKWLRLRWGEEPWRIWLLFLGKKENLPAVAVRGAQRGMEDYQVAIKTKLSLEKKKNSRLL